MRLFHHNQCDHHYKIIKRSNAVQFDDKNRALRLCICECTKCGHTDHLWLNSIIDKESFILVWENVN